MVPCHFTPECSNETEQREEIHWWPLASPHHCRSRLRWCKDQLTPGGQRTNRRTAAPASLGAQTSTFFMSTKKKKIKHLKHEKNELILWTNVQV